MGRESTKSGSESAPSSRTSARVSFEESPALAKSTDSCHSADRSIDGGKSQTRFKLPSIYHLETGSGQSADTSMDRTVRMDRIVEEPLGKSPTLEKSTDSGRFADRSVNQKRTIYQSTDSGGVASKRTIYESGGASMDHKKSIHQKRASNAPATNMFAAVNNLKEDIYENIDQKDYDVTDFYHQTGCCQAIARNESFGTLTLAVISVNAVWIGIDSDHNGAATLADAELHFQIAEHLFCTFFTFEWGARFGSFARKRDCLRDHWFKFDTVLVVLMVGETWIIPFLAGSSGGSGGMGNLALFKMLRLLRLTRMVRIMRAMPELMTMLKGMAAASRSVGATFALLIIFMYIFAIIFATQLSDNEELSEEWGTIPKAMWVLLIGGTFLDELTDVAEALRDNSHPLLVALFLLFVLISSLTILNMLIGVLCEVVGAVAEAEKEKAVVTYVKSTLIDILIDLDTDGTGTITKSEFAVLLDVPSACEALEQLGVDVPNLLLLADVLFDADSGPASKSRKTTSPARSSWNLEELEQAGVEDGGLEDEDGGVELTFTELLEMIIRLRSENTASVPDIVDLRKFIRWSSNQQAEVLKELKRDVDSTRRAMRDHMESIDRKLDTLMEKHLKSIERIKGKTMSCVDQSVTILPVDPQPPPFQETIEVNQITLT